MNDEKSLKDAIPPRSSFGMAKHPLKLLIIDIQLDSN